MTIQIRNGTVDDAGRIVAMIRELALYCRIDMTRFGVTAEIVRSLIETERSEFFLAWDGTQAVGVINLHLIPMGWSGVSGLYVEDLYVAEAYRRGSGVGRTLITRAAERALELATVGGRPEAAFLRLDTDKADNDDTIGFYRKLGFTDHEINFRLRGDALTALIDRGMA